MNRVNKSLSFLIIAALAILGSCRNGEKNPPLISIDKTELTVLPGDTIDIVVNYDRGDRQINHLKIKGIKELLIFDNEDNNTYNYRAQIPGGAFGTTITVTFTVDDCKGNENSVDLMLTVETPFWTKKEGTVNNAQGPSNNAWDLVGNKWKTSIDANSDKDIIDRTSGATGAFLKGGWSSGNGTSFVLDTTYNYDRASVETAKIAFEAGESYTNIPFGDLEVGSLFIAKLRDTEDFAIIEIIDVYDDGTDGGTGNNSDYRKFKYQK